MKRRQWITGSIVGALGGVGVVGAGSAQASAQGNERAIERVGDAIQALRTEWRDERQFPELAPIRAAQKSHLRSNGKFPDFLDVGVDVWFQVHDWHVRWQHPMAQGRDAQGRLTLQLQGTQIILRPDALANFVGLPYDAR